MPGKEVAQILLLIELVREEPAIYDSRCKEHSDRHFINSFWKTVAKKIGKPQWTEQSCRKKWKNLRDTFRRAMTAKDKGIDTGPVKATKWLFYESLTFLRPFMVNSAPGSVQVPSDSLTDSSADGCEEDDGELDSVFGYTIKEEPEPMNFFREAASSSNIDGSSHSYNDVPSHSYSDVPSPSTHSNSSRAKRKADSSLDSAWDSMLQEHRFLTQLFVEQMTQQCNSKSPSLAFLESFAPRMDNLPPHIQSVVRIQIAQIFHNAENVDMHPPVPIVPIPSEKNSKKSKNVK